MAAVLWDDVATRVQTTPETSAPAPKLTLAPAPKQVRRGYRPVGGDPLVDGAARLLSIPVQQLYAALLRVGLLEVWA